MTDSVVAEGLVKMRDGKKWRTRWVVVRKPSPVADCLVLLVCKDRGVKEKNSVVLEHICGLEVGVGSDGVAFTLAILGLTNATLLGFDSKETLLSWDVRLRYCLGEVHSFSVIVLPGTNLKSGPATLHLCNHLLVIARDHPPVIAGQWNLLDLRRYGPLTNGFVFEGGTRCGQWAGVFVLSCVEGEQISFLFDCIVRGISPSRAPFGLRPLLPELSANPGLAGARLDKETAELEKRLSLLSHRTASSSSSSVAGDDCSTSGSSHKSDASLSDSSAGSLLPQWAEPAPPIIAEKSFPSAAGMVSHGDEKLPINVIGVAKVPSNPAPSQRLQEIGWQSSSDSGIATASHSSYSGSCSSYTACVDAGSPTEEYSSLLGLSLDSDLERSLCTCPSIHAHEYQVPCSLRYLYDTPRSLLHIPQSPVEGAERTRQPAQMPTELSGREQSEKPAKEQTKVSAPSLCIPEPSRDSAPSLLHRHGLPYADAQLESVTSPHPAAPRALFTTCPVCRGLKRAPVPPSVAAIQSCETGKSSLGSIRTSLYEQMSSAVAAPPFPVPSGPRLPAPSHHPSPSSIYDNCLQCRRGQGSCVLPAPDSASVGRGLLPSLCLQNIDSDLPEELPQAPPRSGQPPDQLGDMETAEEEKNPGGAVERARLDPSHRNTEHQRPDGNSEAGENSRGEPPSSCGQQRPLTLPLQHSQGQGSTKYAQIGASASEAVHSTQHSRGWKEGFRRLEQKKRRGSPE